MTMVCKICSHPKRLDIDRQIVQGGSLAKIAKDYDLNYNGVYNHATHHVSRQLAQAWEKKQLEQDFDLLHKIDMLVIRAEDIFRRNYDKGKDTIALKAISEQRSTFELLAKISYSLHQAKLAEIEMARIQTGQVDHEMAEMAKERLQILTTPELKMHLAICKKLESGDRKTIIIPEGAKIERIQNQQEPEPEIIPEKAPKVDPYEDLRINLPDHYEPSQSIEQKMTRRDGIIVRAKRK